MSRAKLTLPLPAPHARVNGKLGTFCSFESTQARRGDAVYTEEQVSALVAQAEAMLDDLAERRTAYQELMAAHVEQDELNAQLREQNTAVGEACADYEAEVKRITADLDAYRAAALLIAPDATRYRFLRDFGEKFAICELVDGVWVQLARSPNNVDATIDAAMNSGQAKEPGP